MPRTTVEKPRYNELLERFHQAEDDFQQAQVDIANDMADSLINNGGVTIRIEQFALAMYGIVDYRSLARRSGLLTAPDLESDNDVHRTLDGIERSARGNAGVIMMHRHGREYAVSPDSLRYPPRDAEGPTGYQPLRFVVQPDKNLPDTFGYYGYVLLPVLTVDWKNQQAPKPAVIKMASLFRGMDSLKIADQSPHRSEYQDDWYIGKQAIVGAGIVDYSTTVENDINFLQRLSTATATLNKHKITTPESAWDEVLAKSHLTYGAD